MNEPVMRDQVTFTREYAKASIEVWDVGGNAVALDIVGGSWEGPDAYLLATADEAARLGSSLLYAAALAKRAESPVDSPT